MELSRDLTDKKEKEEKTVHNEFITLFILFFNSLSLSLFPYIYIYIYIVVFVYSNIKVAKYW